MKKQEETKPTAEPIYKRYTDYAIDMYLREPQGENRLLRGRALLTPQKGEMLFVQAEARGARSVEVGRTLHSRFVRRPDGAYTVTLRFSAEEKQIREQLLAEVRQITTTIEADKKRVQAEKVEARRKEATGNA